MKMIHWRVIPLLLFALLVIFLWRGLSLEPQKLPSTKEGKPLPTFDLPQLGEDNSHFKPSDMQGKIALLNVWASWCVACTDEHLFLLELARQQIPIYGLNYKDDPKDALQWLQEWGNPYQMIGSDVDGRVAIDFGVYGAPETFLIDKKGIIRYRYAGLLDATSWNQEFIPRIKQLEHEE